MPDELAAVERELRGRLIELRRQLAALTRSPERGAELQFGKRVGDGTTEAVSRLSDVAVVASLHATEGRVQRALAKLADGSYGICDACGEPIAGARLRVAPESTRCVNCARSSG
jgi:RNA polymerase-binding transcription factor